MSAASRLKFFYLAYASKPAAERALYRAVRRHRMSRIVEFGMTSLARSRRLIEVAQRYAASPGVSFTAIDPFESALGESPAHAAQPPSLKEVFRVLRPTQASLRLLPGSLAEVLPDVANTLPATDLLLIGHTAYETDLAGIWFYLPRMLHPGSLVLVERAAQNGPTFETLPLARIQTLSAHRPRTAA